MRKLLFVGVISIVIIGVTFSSVFGAEFDQLEFGHIEETPTVYAVRMAVDALCNDLNNRYQELYSKGKIWDCIVMVVENLVRREEAEILENGSLNDTLWGKLSIHSNRPWSFWKKYAELGKAGSQFEFEEIFPNSLSQLLNEMYFSMFEVIEPGKTDYYWMRVKNSE